MATKINEIRSVNWQISVNGLGLVAENLSDIKQCIGLIIVTSRGTDPLRPEFGTEIYKQIDRPLNVAAPIIVSEILTGIQLFEPRVRVQKIVYTTDDKGDKLLFDLTLQLLINGRSAELLFEIERLTKAQQPVTDGRSFGRGFSFGFS